MTVRIRSAAAAAAIVLCACAGSPERTQTPSPDAGATREAAAVSTRASGEFEVKMAPLATDAPVGRMSLDKVFRGDLQATSQGEMLTAMTPVEGSAGYVALERVTGTLAGRAGTFVLQHFGIMDRGAPRLTIRVVPDSGTGGLEGLSGTMDIVVAGGKHSYEFDYTLPGS